MELEDILSFGSPVVLFSLLAWIGRRELRSSSEKHKETDQRLRELETNRVTKADFNRLDAKIDDLGVQMNSQHSRIMQLLIEQKRDQR